MIAGLVQLEGLCSASTHLSPIRQSDTPTTQHTQQSQEEEDAGDTPTAHTHTEQQIKPAFPPPTPNVSVLQLLRNIQYPGGHLVPETALCIPACFSGQGHKPHAASVICHQIHTDTPSCLFVSKHSSAPPPEEEELAPEALNKLGISFQLLEILTCAAQKHAGAQACKHLHRFCDEVGSSSVETRSSLLLVAVFMAK